MRTGECSSLYAHISVQENAGRPAGNTPLLLKQVLELDYGYWRHATARFDGPPFSLCYSLHGPAAVRLTACPPSLRLGPAGRPLNVVCYCVIGAGRGEGALGDGAARPGAAGTSWRISIFAPHRVPTRLPVRARAAGRVGGPAPRVLGDSLRIELTASVGSVRWRPADRLFSSRTHARLSALLAWPAPSPWARSTDRTDFQPILPPDVSPLSMYILPSAFCRSDHRGLSQRFVDARDQQTARAQQRRNSLHRRKLPLRAPRRRCTPQLYIHVRISGCFSVLERN